MFNSLGRWTVGGVLLVALLGGGFTLSQEDIDCTEAGLATLLEQSTLDSETAIEDALPDLYRVGLAYQQYAVACGYRPSPEETAMLAESVLAVVDVSTLLQATSVGRDVDAILADLETVDGNLTNGQLLYNGLEPGLDGASLGCAGCHSESEIAPPTSGTWTRVDEIRLQTPELDGYSVDRYLVESIVQPNAYLVPGYQANLMPTVFGDRLDTQQLADLLAYLKSQDQLLDE